MSTDLAAHTLPRPGVALPVAGVALFAGLGWAG